MKKKRALTNKHELTNRLERKKLSVEELVQTQIQSGNEEGLWHLGNVYTNETGGTVSFSASHDK